MDKRTYAVVDLETTGHSSTNGDRIIQIAIVFIQNGRIGDAYVRFVNPGKEIPAFIRQLTSISDEDVLEAPSFEEIAEEVADLLEGSVFVAHNTDFDLAFLQNEFQRCGIRPWSGQKIDTVELAKIMFPSSPSYRLQDITEELGIPLVSAHRADDDAAATAQLFMACLAKLDDLPRETLELLHRRSFLLKSDLSTVFYEALKAARTRADDDRAISSYRGIPYRIAKAPAEKVTELPNYPESEEAKIALFSKRFNGFEKRDAQFDFMDAVRDVFAEHSEMAAEVPTGIGKTIAYLLPAAIHSVQSGKPVVVSTYTNHLVDKIVGEEMDKVRLLLGAELPVAVLKGREQYISLGKFEELLRITDESYDETFTAMQILVWLTETVTGDLEELNVSGGGQLFLNRIRKRSEQMPPDEKAADYHAKQITACQSANLIITNHSMLLSDLNREQTVLHPLAGVIVDEAHQFVQTASRMNETVFSYTNWKYCMGQVGSDAEGQLLQQMESLNIDCRRESYRPIEKAKLDAAFIDFSVAFENAVDYLTGHKPTTSEKQSGNRITYPLPDTEADPSFREVAFRLSVYLDQADRFAQEVVENRNRLTKKGAAILAEWEYWVRELKIKAGEWIEIFLDDERQDYAVWVEKDRRSIPGSLMVMKTRLYGTGLVRQFAERMKTEQAGIMWTSGTLSVAGDERYVTRQLGMADSVPLLKFDAPPHFYEGAEIFIVEDMPDIQQVAQSDYIEAVANAVVQTVLVTNGRLFVLFTSQDMLRKTYELIVESEQLEDFVLIAQGVSSGSRMRLLKSFRQYSKAVLFGTSSFWEGVDVPGEALSAVIVVRLPFSSPDDPLFKARAAKLTEQGIHPFNGYSLPEAVMRLRQGFGRLIRASSDKGFFILLDRRIETKSYGRRFLESLPDVPIRKVTLENMVTELENCYND
ncbi:ATP-dependent DNA helicase DinG [Sporosarcina sp. 179-K 3D1 HS]|uniref:ATP-dependent DNA helicase DinG n=1 Tax=Sporosarcina sp. 179-K 3D1 HS TaxID=3232169 RepID=UPI0039A02A9A